jgi:hypothetical protein
MSTLGDTADVNPVIKFLPHGLWLRPACSFRSARQPLCWNFMYHSPIVLSVGGSVWYMVRNFCCIVTIDSVLAYSKRENTFLFPVHAMFRHDGPLEVKPASTPRHLVYKQIWRDSLPIDMLLSAVPVLVVAQPSMVVPEGLMNYPVHPTQSLVKGPIHYKLNCAV